MYILMCQRASFMAHWSVIMHAIVQLGLNVSSFAHNCGCVVNGGNTMAAI